MASNSTQRSMPNPASPAQARGTRLAVALGDPAGIGAEVVLKALHGWPRHQPQPLLVGCRRWLEQQHAALRAEHMSVFTAASGDQFANAARGGGAIVCVSSVNALVHVGQQLGETGDNRTVHYYNGFSHAEIGTAWGFRKLGIEKVPPVSAPGVLVDLAVAVLVHGVTGLRRARVDVGAGVVAVVSDRHVDVGQLAPGDDLRRVPVPVAVGVPEMTPVVGSMLRPLGKPVALKVGAGEPVATTVKVPATPAENEAVAALVMAGACATVLRAAADETASGLT